MTEEKKLELWLKAMEHCGRCGCHQRPDRSFFIGRWQMPLCARCTGVIIGHCTGLALALKKRIPLGTSLCLCAVMLADWSLQKADIKQSTNMRRLITGIMGGVGTTAVYVLLLGKIFSALKRKIYG